MGYDEFLPEDGNDDEDEDEDSDEFDDDVVIELLEDGEGHGMSDLMADDDLLDNESSTAMTDQVRLDRRGSSIIGRTGIGSEAKGTARTFSGRSSRDTTSRRSDHALRRASISGHSLENRLRIVQELAGKGDGSLNAVLIGHLESIRAEAEESGQTNLAKQAARLWSRMMETGDHP